jgi:phage replication O-like protein O
VADVQPENGCLTIAFDLSLALLRHPLTNLELKILLAIMHLTYGNNKTKAVIEVEDLRYLMGAEKSLRTDRLLENLNNLVAKNLVLRQQKDDKQVLGVQKDFDKWQNVLEENDKMSPTINSSYSYSKKGTRSVGDKMSTPELLLDYAQKQSHIKYSLNVWRVERKFAKQLYMEALQLTRDPVVAAQTLKDYIDGDEWMRQNVRHQFTYMSSRFKQWYKSLPAKPRDVKDNEKITGKTYRYNTRTKTWVPR